ncbi:unnamed protein product [Adineta steineri]|uniref:C2H2-type domain-containing protein n=2 Tax=Adineta steineri TaxID=433720 RepID=A0A818HYV4_9BILA|nr:unnamed protein product [Adineta steineri]
MIMSRRKQLRPKSFKGNEILFVLPDELLYDEETNFIITRTNLNKDHRFGPFPATIHIDDKTECFQLLDIKHNWFVHCSVINNNNTSENLNIIYQDNQLFAIVTKSISIGTYLCTNKIILPKLNMNKDIEIKDEPLEISLKKHSPLVYTCDTCNIRFSNRNTLDAHRQHYCMKQETTKSHSADSWITFEAKSMKRKSPDNSDSLSTPTKRLSLLSHNTYCHKCDDISFSKVDNLIQDKLSHCTTNSSCCKLKNQTIPFDCPVQVGNFIYVPIPVIPTQIKSSNQDNKPLDLSKPKEINDECQNSVVLSNSPLDLSIEKNKKTIQQEKQQQQLYRCEYCFIHFRTLKTLQAHQDNYCIEYKKQKTNDKNPLTNTNNTTRSQLSSSTVISDDDDLNQITYSNLYICRLCQYRANSIRGIRMHFKFHLSNNEPCSDSDIIIKTIKKKSSIIPKLTQSLLKCTICSAMFDYEDTLLNHIKCVHINETSLRCLECQSRFCSKWNLIRHMKFSHTNIKYDEQGQECFLDKNIKTSSSSDSTNLTTQKIDRKSVEKNLSNENSIRKKFSCPFCYIKFGNFHTLKQHMSNYCSLRPTTKNVLNNIKKKLTDDTFCSLCQISFQYKTSYDAHKMYYCRGNNNNNQTNVKISV